MKITGLIWLKEIVQKLIWKHSVENYEVHEMFASSPRFHFVENGHRKGENIYAAQGQTDDGRYLICYFIYKTDKKALILSARDMTKSERKRYGRK